MADAVLTSLCGICHINTPKYKCPRCSIATCSLACITKHKSWSQCSGARDQTAYVAKSKLATPAGVDHDYNFLHGIEMASERAERVFVEDKGIIQKDELRPLTVEEVRWKVGRDGRRRKVLVTRVLKRGRERPMEKLLASKLRRQGTVLVSAPQGMTRHRENHTTVSRRPGKINWQVEWFTFERSAATDSNEVHKSRALSKLMEDVPLYKGYSALLASQAKAEGKVQRRPFKSVAQNSPDVHWQVAVDSLQDPQTGRWFTVTTPSIDEWPQAKDESQRRQFQFFLESTRKRPDRLVTVTSIPPEECLRDILRNTRVLEFPTLYVLREGEALPAGYVLGPKDVVSHTAEQGQNSKRKIGPEHGRDNSRPAKRKRRGDEDDMEEGELGDDGDQDDDRSKTVDGTVVDEVVAEQSLDDDDEDDDTSDDETSSSGSDSD
ncbi:hypothetical protein TgHK011_001028 [Trichoderma gracile]|nr:hypothetical protein TgHK011_001028 [Trichoderma gracile]